MVTSIRKNQTTFMTAGELIVELQRAQANAPVRFHTSKDGGPLCTLSVYGTTDKSGEGTELEAGRNTGDESDVPMLAEWVDIDIGDPNDGPGGAASEKRAATG